MNLLKTTSLLLFVLCFANQFLAQNNDHKPISFAFGNTFVAPKTSNGLLIDLRANLVQNERIALETGINYGHFVNTSANGRTGFLNIYETVQTLELPVQMKVSFVPNFSDKVYFSGRTGLVWQSDFHLKTRTQDAELNYTHSSRIENNKSLYLNFGFEVYLNQGKKLRASAGVDYRADLKRDRLPAFNTVNGRHDIMRFFVAWTFLKSE